MVLVSYLNCFTAVINYEKRFGCTIQWISSILARKKFKVKLKIAFLRERDPWTQSERLFKIRRKDIRILIKVMSDNILEDKIGKPGAFAIYAISGMLAICALLMFLKFCKPKAKIPTRNSVTVIAIPIE